MRRLKVCLGLVLAMLIMMAAPLTVSALEPFDNFYVNDYVGILSNETVSDLASRGSTLREENGVQVVTVIVNNYIGDSMESYANEVFNDFGIGSKEDNNGVLLMLAVDDREVRIEVGDGLSGLLPDSKTGSIIDDYFIPSAKEGDFEKAIKDTYVELIRVSSRLTTEGVPNQANSQYDNGRVTGNTNNHYSRHENTQSHSGINLFTVIIGFMVLFFIIAFISRIRNIRRNNNNYYNNPNVFYPPPPPPPPPSHQGGGFWGSSNSDNDDDNPPGGGFWGGGHSSGGGGLSSGGGAGRNFGSGFSGGGRPFGGGHSSGGGGRSSGGGAGRKF